MSTLAPLAAQRAGPYTHAANSVGRTMAWVMVALLPATLHGWWLFGLPAVLLWCVTVGSALVFEAALLQLRGQPLRARLGDGSAMLTGWLLALSLPPWAPWWVGVLGSGVAIVIAKHLFGGLGQNPFNPAMVARVVLLISFPVPMTLWVAPVPLGSAAAPTWVQALAITAGAATVPDHLSAATAMGAVKTDRARLAALAVAPAAGAGGEPAASAGPAPLPPAATVAAAPGAGPVAAAPARAGGAPVPAPARPAAALPEPTPAAMALGAEAGSLGETSALLLLAGGGLLLALRIISWHTPVALLGTLGALAALSHAVAPAQFASAGLHLLSGAAVLGAFFIATDYVTSPMSRAGQLVFGAGIGALTWLIRSLGAYPEGLAFAVLIMNALVPLIDRGMRPRVFGRDRRGQPMLPGGVR